MRWNWFVLLCGPSQTPCNCSDTAQSAAQPGEAGLFTPQNNERVAEDQTRTAAYSPRACTRWFIGASFTASSMKVLQKTSVFLKIQAQAAFSLRQCICTLTAPVGLLLDFFLFFFKSLLAIQTRPDWSTLMFITRYIERLTTTLGGKKMNVDTNMGSCSSDKVSTSSTS